MGVILLGVICHAQKDTNIITLADSLYKNESFKALINLSKTYNIELTTESNAHFYFLLAKSYENLNKEDSAFIFYKKTLDYYNQSGLKEKATEISNDIYLLLDSRKQLKSNKEFYLNEIYNYAKKTNSSKWLSTYYVNTGIDFFKRNLPDSAKHQFYLAIKHNIPINITIQKNINSLLGSLYSNKYGKHDSAIYFYNNALKLYYSDTLANKNLNAEFNLFNNIGNNYKRKKDYLKAIEYFKKAEPLELPKLNGNSKKILYNNMSATYYYQQDWKNAYNYLYKYDSIKDVINLNDQNTRIANIQEQYDNQKLRADNLEIETKRKQNKNLLIGALIFILFGSITAFLIYKNIKKKQKLALQEKALESQKLATVLKEQELLSIDAMIEGQEKERQRIANDLHDDLGGIMATVKLHFNALKNNPNAELFERANTLLDEAYHKVRTIAHAKNSGVIAKQGLLKAVQNMADKISASNKIRVDVVDHGLENRLENSLELTIFRIIQELITNIIKHAEATEATIHLTNHDDSLNIMIEDNGKGFNPSQITKTNKGMGISSIDKRVEHLNGSMTIESETNKGTTIIIDLPL